mmetsp:Transcript_23801/g.47384  ORF Transcript_23801/g.47384 Transcript_23801/m.47384 type:complete len:182 (+) Transcript_23801:471-1016(+)
MNNSVISHSTPPRLALVRRDTSSDKCIAPSRPRNDSLSGMDISTPSSATTQRDRTDSYTSAQELASFFRPPGGHNISSDFPGACRPETLTPDFLAGPSEPMALPVFRRTCYSSEGLESMTASGSGMSSLLQSGAMAVDVKSPGKGSGMGKKHSATWDAVNGDTGGTNSGSFGGAGAKRQRR